MTGDPWTELGIAAGSGGDLLSASFTIAEVSAVRHQVRQHCVDAGLAGDELDDFVLAVHELVTNAVRHGGGSGRLRLYLRDDTLTCEVRDDGDGSGMLRPHLPAGDIPGGRGLWLAQNLTAGLMIAAGPAGVSATVSICLAPASVKTPLAAALPVLDRPDPDAGPSTAEEGTR